VLRLADHIGDANKMVGDEPMTLDELAEHEVWIVRLIDGLYRTYRKSSSWGHPYKTLRDARIHATKIAKEQP
jgi:hypothetical protein